jgi:hypothetical protein
LRTEFAASGGRTVMSNYPEGNDPNYAGGPPAADYPPHERRPEERPYQSQPPAGGPGMGSSQYGGEQYAVGPMHQPTQQFSNYGGATSYPGGGSNRRGFDLRSTFKTTEFWIFVIVAIGLLIASAVTDENADGQGFSAFDAWRWVVVLAVGYMISRGLTKFGGHEHDCGRHEQSDQRRP